jgi:hypothetical protein
MGAEYKAVDMIMPNDGQIYSNIITFQSIVDVVDVIMIILLYSRVVKKIVPLLTMTTKVCNRSHSGEEG